MRGETKGHSSASEKIQSASSLCCRQYELLEASFSSALMQLRMIRQREVTSENNADGCMVPLFDKLEQLQVEMKQLLEVMKALQDMTHSLL
jgi:hypothetical protein